MFHVYSFAQNHIDVNFFLLQIQIPIRRRYSGPAERIIPISPVKYSPKASPPKLPPKPGSDSMAYTAGFKPTKITLNRYGGGGYDFGYTPKTPPAHGIPQPQYYQPPSPPRQQYQPSPPQQMQPSPPQPTYMSQTKGNIKMVYCVFYKMITDMRYFGFVSFFI